MPLTDTDINPGQHNNLILISCSTKAGASPKALEHQDIRWVTPTDMRQMPFCPADSGLIEKLFPKT